LLLVGLILIATGYSGWCPAYSGFGKNTCEKGEDKPAQTASAAQATVTEEKKPAAKKTAAKKPSAKKTAAKKTTED
ncbi:MAG: YgaP family membrane protein, partial [Gammaproteobacteria bacterium]